MKINKCGCGGEPFLEHHKIQGYFYRCRCGSQTTGSDTQEIALIKWNTSHPDISAQIAELTRENAVLKRVIEEAIDIIGFITGSCPLDQLNWEHPQTCAKYCDIKPSESECWKTYLLAEAEQEVKNEAD